ncbi:MAG: XrtA-associated tyrosine autokinase [Gammaproteobacteria bacterium]|nr:XrtA-associated tyrosine autokinase [Gammaproteobacteria bacterium]
MSQNLDQNDSSATITELVAMSEQAAEKEGRQFFRHSADESTREQVKRETDKVDIKDRLRSQNMLVQGSKLGPRFVDEYRRIKRPLLSNAFGKSSSLIEKGNLILVTSSIPGEGKTHTAINLALSIAQERDHTVLLVDCDVTRHGCSRLLGIADRPGLVDIIEDDSFTVGDAILRTDVPELSLISAGKQHDFVTELLASQKMSELVAEIGERYDDRVIIFDGPPLLSTPQTQVLTGLVGQIVFVVEAGKTPQSLVEEALTMIPEEQATGLVMNKSEGISGRSGYYYGYYGSD